MSTYRAADPNRTQMPGGGYAKPEVQTNQPTAPPPPNVGSAPRRNARQWRIKELVDEVQKRHDQVNDYAFGYLDSSDLGDLCKRAQNTCDGGQQNTGQQGAISALNQLRTDLLSINVKFKQLRCPSDFSSDAANFNNAWQQAWNDVTASRLAASAPGQQPFATIGQSVDSMLLAANAIGGGCRGKLLLVLTDMESSIQSLLEWVGGGRGGAGSESAVSRNQAFVTRPHENPASKPLRERDTQVGTNTAPATAQRSQTNG